MLILGSWNTCQVGPAFEPHSMLSANPVRQGDTFDGRNGMILPSENAEIYRPPEAKTEEFNEASWIKPFLS